MNVLDATILALSFFALLGIGVPVAYSVGLSALLALCLALPGDVAVVTISQRMVTGVDSFAMLAIPFFILAGQIMNRGGIAGRLIELAKASVGMLPGGLAFVNIVASMLFGAISGSAIAAASAIGGVMHPRLTEAGYPKSYSVAVNVTSATTGMVIPPSNILIIYSLASGGVSVGALFVAGYIPGLLVGLSLMLVAGAIAHREKYPVAGRASLKEWFAHLGAAVPSLLLLVIVIGGIVFGVFTATEASAIAVLYAGCLAGAYGELKWGDVPRLFLDAARTTGIVMLLIASSVAMSWVMSFGNIPQTLSAALLSVSDNKVVVLLIINIILLLVGIFMDMTPAVLIFAPIFLPVVTELGVDPIHFGIIMVLNLCIGLCTPPVGSVLFVGCGVGGVSIREVVRPLLPLFAAMLVSLLLVTFIPALSLTLPRWLGL